MRITNSHKNEALRSPNESKSVIRIDPISYSCKKFLTGLKKGNTSFDPTHMKS